MNPLATLSVREWSTAVIVVVLAIAVAVVGNFFSTSAQRQGAEVRANGASERLIERKRNSALPIEPVSNRLQYGLRKRASLQMSISSLIRSLISTPQISNPCPDPGFPAWIKCNGAASDNCRRKVA